VRTTTRLTINGRETELTAHPMSRLLDVLREDLKLTGTKEGCGEGECGACSILVVTTIEGLGDDHPLQHAFMDEVGAQCGICTPGMIVAALPLLDAHDDGAHLTLDKIKTQLAGNLCRCTGYEAIYRAILKAATAEGLKVDA
jgi:carbon-monoxide dehydrogenase small subunit